MFNWGGQCGDPLCNTGCRPRVKGQNYEGVKRLKGKGYTYHLTPQNNSKISILYIYVSPFYLGSLTPCYVSTWIYVPFHDYKVNFYCYLYQIRRQEYIQVSAVCKWETNILRMLQVGACGTDYLTCVANDHKQDIF